MDKLETINNLENSSDLKFYTKKAITTATFLGGPLAGVILLRKNFINNNNEKDARFSLIMGIIVTLCLFGLVFVPDSILDKIPNIVMPALYSLIMHLIVVHYQDKFLKEHEENKRPFYSAWRVALITLIAVVASIVLLIGIYFVIPEDFDSDQYNEEIDTFIKNEEKAIEFYTFLENNQTTKARIFLKETWIPTWKENLIILDRINKIEGLTDEYLINSRELEDYCKLRIESYELFYKALNENTDKYDNKLEELNIKIGKYLE